MNDQVDLLKAYLEELCGHIERGERALSWPNWRRRALAAAAPIAVGLSMVACEADMEEQPAATECTGADCATLCADKVDNDSDGTMDCADSDCAAATTCGSVAVYSVPLAESDCSDGVDNDGNGEIDCADAKCIDDISCTSVAEYAVVMTETECADGLDNDYDQHVDCGDSDCAAVTACVGVKAETNCSDAIDDDGDGTFDCDDADCSCAVPIYSTFMEPT